jgi:hypothetical protein
MGNLCEVAIGECEVVFQKVAVAPIELTTASGPNKKQNARQRLQLARRLNRRQMLLARFGFL